MGFNSRKKAVNEYDSRLIANKIIEQIDSFFSRSSKS